MGKLDEYIANRANKEDGSDGKFWAARFKSTALMDEGALLACMAYVDLNPVRAGIASGLDDSTWTSIYQRLREATEELQNESSVSSEKIIELVTDAHSEEQRLSSNESSSSEEQSTVQRETAEAREPRPEECPILAPMDPEGQPDESLPLTLLQYLELLEWTGRVVRLDKRGSITGPPSQLLERCGLDADKWLETLDGFESFGGYAGHPSKLRTRASQMNRRFLKGQGRQAAMVYSEEPRSFARDSAGYLEAA